MKGESLFSYPHMEACLEKLESVLGGKAKGSILKIYLENFKSFNDTFGFHFGGLFIQEIVKYLSGIEGAELYRVAGVEFVLLLGGANAASAERTAYEIIDRFDQVWNVNGTDCLIAINIGMACYPGHAETPEQMMEILSQAVGESAAMGQNQLVTYNEDLKRKLYRRNSIAMDIPKALEQGRIEIRYRPSQDIEKGRFTRADCYLRMLHPEFGIIQSAELIPIAEESGQINAVGQFAVTTVCKMISALLGAGKDFETIAVPISPIQLMQENFTDNVARAIADTGIPADRLAFEISDASTIMGYTSSQMRVQALADMGIEFVLTDFGTGYTGINSVLNLPVGTVKLERLLIWQMDNDERVAPLVSGLIGIAKKLDLKLIAEGVETEAQVKKLKKFGCGYEQGFYYSSTMAGDELMDVFAES